MSNNLEELKGLKKFHDLPIDEIVYFRSDGQLHGQIIYNVFSSLRTLVNVVSELQEELAKKEDAIDVNDIKEVKNING